jgi:hypothetical protein
VISSSNGISIEGDYLLDLINNHCLSGNIIYSVISSSNDDSMSTTSSRLSSLKNLEKFLEKRFSDVKLVSLDNQQDGQRLLRKLIEQKLIKSPKICLRPYLFAQAFSYENPKVKINSFLLIYCFLLVTNKYIQINGLFTWNRFISKRSCLYS